MSKSSLPKRPASVRAIFQTLLEDAMKYLCLVYQEEKQEANVPRDQIEQAKKDYWAFAEDIKKSGHYLVSHGLQHTDAATTVRVRNGKLSTTDGPWKARRPIRAPGSFPRGDSRPSTGCARPAARWRVRRTWRSSSAIPKTT